MVHDLSPFAIRIFGDFGVRWYGLSYMMGFICAYFLISWLTKRQRTGITQEMVMDLITYCAIGTLAGGRLGYCLFYAPDLFTKFKVSFPFWGVLAVNEGGMASHGGIIGIVLGCIFFARKYNQSALYTIDLVAVVGPIGVIFGRIANFINGELVGRIAPADYPFAVKFPSDIFLWPKNSYDRLKTLVEAVKGINVDESTWLNLLDKAKLDQSAREQMFAIINKLVEATQTGNEAVKEALGKVLDPRYPSQLFAAAGEGLLTFLILFFMWRTPKKPGAIASTFIMVYAIVRIGDEFFRMPDDHIGLQWLGLSRGQWLSIVMFTVGLVLKLFWSRTQGKIIPGWSAGKSIKLNRK